MLTSRWDLFKSSCILAFVLGFSACIKQNTAPISKVTADDTIFTATDKNGKVIRLKFLASGGVDKVFVDENRQWTYEFLEDEDSSRWNKKKNLLIDLRGVSRRAGRGGPKLQDFLVEASMERLFDRRGNKCGDVFYAIKRRYVEGATLAKADYLDQDINQGLKVLYTAWKNSYMISDSNDGWRASYLDEGNIIVTIVNGRPKLTIIDGQAEDVGYDRPFSLVCSQARWCNYFLERDEEERARRDQWRAWQDHLRQRP